MTTAFRALVGCACVAIVCAFATGAAAAFRVRSFWFTDPSRTILLPDGRRVPRLLETVVRYPAAGTQHPLIVFAHGFALTPAAYDRLLSAWTQAGYVVAAPVFPLENANAPGGPTQSDLVNEPQDVSFVITRLLALDERPNGLLAGRIDWSQIAVAGHSDGAVAALAVAYGRGFRDPRVRAAIVMSGAALPWIGPFSPRGPPLLAVQGTADALNSPATTAAYFLLVHRPKFLLWLLGGSTRLPYTFQEPQLGIVERATVAFLDHYLRGRPLQAFDEAAESPGLTRLIANP